MQVEQQIEGTAIVLRAVGEIDAASATVLTDQLAHAAKTAIPPGPVVLDLRAIEFMGSAGMAMLIATHQLCQDQHVVFRVVAGPTVTRRLELLGLLTFVTIRLTLDEALHGTDSNVSTPVT
jgi:anti-anti-sigma factor